MIRHIVLIRFRTDLPEPVLANLLALLGPLSERLGFAASWGRSASPEQIERGYLHGFVADFSSWEALATYQADPGHQVFGTGLVAHAEGGLNGILVFDLVAFPSAPLP